MTTYELNLQEAAFIERLRMPPHERRAADREEMLASMTPEQRVAFLRAEAAAADLRKCQTPQRQAERLLAELARLPAAVVEAAKAKAKAKG